MGDVETLSKNGQETKKIRKTVNATKKKQRKTKKKDEVDEAAISSPQWTSLRQGYPATEAEAVQPQPKQILFLSKY